MRLAWRACVDRVELVPVLPDERERIALVELKRVARLRRDIDADNFEARLMQPHARAARTAKQVESAWFCSHQHLVAFSVCVR